jgi:hypothetical protein
MTTWDEPKFAQMISKYYMSCGKDGFAKSNKLYVEIVEFIDSLLDKQREDLTVKVGMLRQWLNEERIKRADRFVTNKQLLEWLK